MSNCEKAVEILHKTRDGHDLYQSAEEIERHGRNGDGAWLKLVEMAVNGFLNERGQRLFDALHRRVIAGDYKYPVGEFVEKFCPALKE